MRMMPNQWFILRRTIGSFLVFGKNLGKPIEAPPNAISYGPIFHNPLTEAVKRCAHIAN